MGDKFNIKRYIFAKNIMNIKLKKNILLSFTFVAIVFFGCHLDKNQKTYFYHIKGELVDEQPDSIFLYKAGNYLGFTFDKIAAAKVENGRFRFDGEFNHAELYYVGISEQANLPFFVSSHEIRLEGSLQRLVDIEITGAQLNEQLLAFEARLKLAKDSQQELEMIDEFIQNQADSPINPYLILNYRYHIGNFEELNHLYNLMDLSLRTHPYSVKIKSQMNVLELVQQGKLAPEIISKDTAGNEKRLSSLRGSYVLIEFWASWCGPCRAENSDLLKFYQEIKSKNLKFEIFAIAAEFDKSQWIAAINKDQLPWYNTSLLNGFDEKAFNNYGVKSIPASVLINPEGRIIARGLEGEALYNKILEVLNH